ncbi:hypothetical protein MJN54_30260, partial [Salmonella enterica subsp. enterica serovar Kentucky]|nr:hypothetical protein [Salmonella enterica subsp. enterica serovar Kentucky]
MPAPAAALLKWEPDVHNENCLIQEGALLFCEQAVVAPVSGDVVFRPLKIEVLSKLLAF